jgi:hypothetical protein
MLDLTEPGKVLDALSIALGVAFVALVARRVLNSPGGLGGRCSNWHSSVCTPRVSFVALRAAFLADWTQAFGTLDWIDRTNSCSCPQRSSPVSRRPIATAVPSAIPSLSLWLPDRRAFVDEAGVEVHGPQAGPGRAVTLVGPPDEPLPALVHHDRLLGQRRLLEAAGPAVRLALENTRLQAELRAQLDELRASRSRIATAQTLLGIPMIACATQSVTTSASVTLRRGVPRLLGQEIGRALNDGAESVEPDVHRGVQVDGVLITADFSLSTKNPTNTTQTWNQSSSGQGVPICADPVGGQRP